MPYAPVISKFSDAQDQFLLFAKKSKHEKHNWCDISPQEYDNRCCISPHDTEESTKHRNRPKSYLRAPGYSCHSLRRRVERLRRSVYPPKMVQLCVRILYARKPTYKILKPV